MSDPDFPLITRAADVVQALHTVGSPEQDDLPIGIVVQTDYDADPETWSREFADRFHSRLGHALEDGGAHEPIELLSNDAFIGVDGTGQRVLLTIWRTDPNRWTTERWPIDAPESARKMSGPADAVRDCFDTWEAELNESVARPDEMPPYREFGKRLRAARKRRYWKWEQLAEAVGVPVSKLKSWEDGVDHPGPADAVSLAGALRVTTSELLGRGR